MLGLRIMEGMILLSVVGGFSYVMWPSLKGLFIKTDTTNKKEWY
jgi:hypothetical protein